MDGIPVDLTATGMERRVVPDLPGSVDSSLDQSTEERMLVPKIEPGNGKEERTEAPIGLQESISDQNIDNVDHSVGVLSAEVVDDLAEKGAPTPSENMDPLPLPEEGIGASESRINPEQSVETSTGSNEGGELNSSIVAGESSIQTDDANAKTSKDPEDSRGNTTCDTDMHMAQTLITIKSEPSRRETQTDSSNEGMETSPCCSTHCAKIMFDIMNQRQFGKFCDVLIKTADHHIWAHKCVLSANSPYFDSFLLSSTNALHGDKGQTEIQELQFNEFSFEILEALISYMYSGNLTLGNIEGDQFLLLADKFLMPDLKLKCSQLISSKISLENWFFTYQMAEKHGLSNLSVAVSNFLIENIDSVVKDLVFLELTSKQLVSLLKRDVTKISEHTELQALKAYFHWLAHDYSNRQTTLCNCLGNIKEDELNKTRTYRFIETDFAELKNDEVLSDPSLINWLLSLGEENEEEHGEEEQEENEDPDYVYTGVSDESVGETDDELFVPGKEIRNVMPSRRTRSGSTPRRKRKSSNPRRVGTEVSPTAATPPVKRGRGRPRSTDPKKKPAPKRKAATSRKKKLLKPANTELIGDLEIPENDIEIKQEPDSPKRALKAQTAKTVTNCPECAQSFTSQNAFRQHMKEHGELAPFKCNLCNFQTVHYGIFTAHKRRQHRVDIQCPKCPREFPSQSALNHHMRGHGSDTPFLCDVCGFTTKHFASMNIHKRRHNGKKLKCPHEGCTYEAVRHTRLRDHMNMHLGLKNYICTVCGKAFGARKHLFRHENIHKTEKTLNCEQCAYTTSRRDKIRQHIKRHHPNTAVVLGYLTEHEAAVQIHKNLNNIKAPPSNGPKKSHKKKKKPKEEVDKPADGVGINLERVEAEIPASTTNSSQLPPPVPLNVIAPIIQSTDQRPEAGKPDLKQAATVTPTAASTIVDMIHYFMAPDGASSEQHHAWSYHSNPL